MNYRLKQFIHALPLSLCACGGPNDTQSGIRPAAQEQALHDDHAGHDHAAVDPAPGTEGHAHAEGENHAHDEAGGHGHDHGTVEHALGTQSAGALQIVASQMDNLVAGGETVIRLLVVSGEANAIRMWIGDEGATRTAKTLAEKEAPDFHGHVEVPNPVTPADKLWLEVEAADGSKPIISFDLPAATMLPAIGPHGGFIVPIDATGGAGRYAEIKLHDDKGDLELWLAQDVAMTQPLDLPLTSVVRVAFAEQNKQVELRPRNEQSNEGEDGKPNVRDGKTDYFIFPGATGADAAWLAGPFRATTTIAFDEAGAEVRSAPFTLIPHVHAPDEPAH